MKRFRTNRLPMIFSAAAACLVLSGPVRASEPVYDLLLKGGHVIDPASGLNAPMDVAVANRTIQRVAPAIPAASARKVLDVSDLYVAPGLIDLHAHLTIGFALGRPAYPADLCLASGVTTVVDAGTCGAVDFPLMKEKVVDASLVRVLVFLNIVAGGMDRRHEQNVAEMEPHSCAETIRRHRDVIVGVKCAHYLQGRPADAEHPPWAALDRALEAAAMAHVPVMLDLWPHTVDRPFPLLLHKLRPGDIETHTYAPHNPVLDEHGRVAACLWEARHRGVLFDLGHGGASFCFRNAVPAAHQGFLPDTISTDLHQGDMNGPVVDLMTTLSKFMAMGLSLDDVIRRATVNPAHALHRPDLGTLRVGACADVAVFALHPGPCSFTDCVGTRLGGGVRLENRLTLRAGRIVYDPSGLSAPEWDRAAVTR